MFENRLLRQSLPELPVLPLSLPPSLPLSLSFSLSLPPPSLSLLSICLPRHLSLSCSLSLSPPPSLSLLSICLPRHLSLFLALSLSLPPFSLSWSLQWSIRTWLVLRILWVRCGQRKTATCRAARLFQVDRTPAAHLMAKPTIIDVSRTSVGHKGVCGAAGVQATEPHVEAKWETARQEICVCWWRVRFNVKGAQCCSDTQQMGS